MHASNGLLCCPGIGETIMKTKVLLIGGVTAATVLAGGWALAQTQGHEHGATDTTGAAQHTQGMGPHAMGHGHMQQMMQHMGHGPMQQKMQHMGHGKRQHMTQGGSGITQPGTTQPQAAQPRGKTGSAHQGH